MQDLDERRMSPQQVRNRRRRRERLAQKDLPKLYVQMEATHKAIGKMTRADQKKLQVRAGILTRVRGRWATIAAARILATTIAKV